MCLCDLACLHLNQRCNTLAAHQQRFIARRFSWLRKRIGRIAQFFTQRRVHRGTLDIFMPISGLNWTVVLLFWTDQGPGERAANTATGIVADAAATGSIGAIENEDGPAYEYIHLFRLVWKVQVVQYVTSCFESNSLISCVHFGCAGAWKRKTTRMVHLISLNGNYIFISWMPVVVVLILTDRQSALVHGHIPPNLQPFRQLDRQDAEALLRRSLCVPGSFIVRWSTSSLSSIVISLRIREVTLSDDNVVHYLINQSSKQTTVMPSI